MRKLFILFITALTLTACGSKQPQNNNLTENEKLIKQYFEHFNNHEWEKMANMYADTSEFKDPSMGKGIVKQTRQQIIDTYSGLKEIFPDVKDEVIQTYPSGDKHVIVEFVSTGTAADGSKFELPICVIFTIENGLITKDFSYFDNFDEDKK